jgi:predicted AAA+ superfamily ATPase
MFENFVIAEMLKLNQYTKSRYSLNYWRTKWGSEVDLVLTKDEKHKAIEIKTRGGKITKTFKETYPDTDELVVTMGNVVSLLI